MTTAATPLIISKKSQDLIISFSQNCYNMLNKQYNLRYQMQKVDRIYQRELDLTEEQARASQANKTGDATRLQNYQVPVVLPQVESAVAYQTAVFLQGTPLFGVVASPAYMDQAIQMESVIDENATRGGWIREFVMMLRDGFKYELAAVEVSWDREVTASYETDITFGNGKVAKPKEVIWEGNKVKRLDLYNTFWDQRVLPADMHKKGEYAGYTEMYTKIALKDFIAKLPDKMVANIKDAFESSYGMTGGGFSGIGGVQNYFIPEVNDEALVSRNDRNNFDWTQWSGLETKSGSKIAYKNVYAVTTLYARIMPIDFELRVPGRNTPQIWKFIIVNHQVVIYAERQTNAHGYLPILFTQPHEDGLGYQTKSLAQNVTPIQEISSALMNSMMASRRRAISDRGLYDPSRVLGAHINSVNPSAKIPVRPAAYGKPLSEAYYPIPFHDDQSGITMQQIGLLGSYANTISGQNPAKQGQFVKGNKTRHEFDTVMGNANSRDQLTSLVLEAQLFTPLKEILKSNILQYQGGTTVYNRARNEDVTIDPVALRNAMLAFKVSDGLTPSDKLIDADALAVALQQIGTSPQIGAAYNIGPLFSYLMKTQGADLAEFEKQPAQVQYEQAMAQYQQLVMQLIKDKPDIQASQYPAAPKPADFGWDPNAQLASQQKAQERN